jgi:hypothetical protein
MVFHDLTGLIKLPNLWKVLVVSPGYPLGYSLGVWGGMWPSITYWYAIVCLLAASALLLIVANRRVGREWAWSDLKSSRPAESRKAASSIKRVSIGRKMLEKNPMLWLAMRNVRGAAAVWFYVGAVLMFWGIGAAIYGTRALFDVELVVVLIVPINGFLKFWMISETCSRMSEDKKSGAFELLLSTPLQPPAIIQGIALSLRRQFGWPVLVLALFQSIPLVLHFHSIQGEFYSRHEFPYMLILAGLVLLFVDAIGLFWTGLWLTLRSRSYTQATLLTASIILVLPWLLHWAASYHGRASANTFFFSSLALDIGLGAIWARRQLRSRFLEYVTGPQK